MTNAIAVSLPGYENFRKRAKADGMGLWKMKDDYCP